MHTCLTRMREYHRAKLEQLLQAASLTRDEIESALFAVDYVEAATMLPYDDISLPYAQLLSIGWIPQYRHLLRLLEMSLMLHLTFTAFVERLLLGRTAPASAPWLLSA